MAVIKACHLIAQLVKNPPAMQETWVRPLGWEDPLEKGRATHSSILAWRIPWTVDPGGLQSLGPTNSQCGELEEEGHLGRDVGYIFLNCIQLSKAGTSH